MCQLLVNAHIGSHMAAELRWEARRWSECVSFFFFLPRVTEDVHLQATRDGGCGVVADIVAA